MSKVRYWNHNTAYYGWIKKKTKVCHTILDVGCGDGSLIGFLNDGSKELIGIDNDRSCIERAILTNAGDGTEFLCCGFDEYTSNISFDAIVFVASIHHMDISKAIIKAKEMLAPNGILLIVGLAKPSSVFDYIIEGLRVLPCLIISSCRHIRTCEDEQIPVSYGIPGMKDVRLTAKELLPSYRLRQGLFYRYLLIWNKQAY